MTGIRTKAERILMKVCKESKLPTNRISPVPHSKSKIGAFRVKDSNGKVIATVRDYDVVIYFSRKIVGYGKVGPKNYEHVTVFKHDDPNLEKALKKIINMKRKKIVIKEEIKELKRAKKTVNKKRKKVINKVASAKA